MGTNLLICRIVERARKAADQAKRLKGIYPRIDIHPFSSPTKAGLENDLSAKKKRHCEQIKHKKSTAPGKKR